MKLQNIAMAVACALIALPLSVMADGVSPFPYAESFESYFPGEPIVNVSGWTGTTGATVQLFFDYTPQLPVSAPITNASHNEVLQLVPGDDGSAVTNSFAIDKGQTLYCDFVGLFGLTDEPTNVQTGNAQAAICVDTNHNINIYSSDLSQSTGTWTVLPNTYVGTDQWVRVTMEFDYTLGGDPVYGWNYFRVWTNGTLLTADPPVAFYDPMDYDTTTPGGSWFVLYGQNINTITNFVLSQAGSIDDLVLDTATPVFGPSAPGGNVMIAVSPTPVNGSISPSIATLPSGSSTNFTILANPYYYITDVQTNGVSIGYPFDVTSTNYPYPWNNITANGYIYATFAPMLAVNGTPYWWLAIYGIGTNDTGDSDSDGSFDWQEYIAGTDPLDPTSFLKISQTTKTNGLVTLKWITAVSNDVSLPPFGILSATNLAVQPIQWTQVDSVTRQAGPYTNAWTTSILGSTQMFYEVVATNWF